MEPDDVVIADIGGQALDIFLHGPECAHKSGIVKTFTHISISILKYIYKEEKNPELTKHDSFVYLSSFCPVWLWRSIVCVCALSVTFFFGGGGVPYFVCFSRSVAYRRINSLKKSVPLLFFFSFFLIVNCPAFIIIFIDNNSIIISMIKQWRRLFFPFFFSC